MEHYARDYPQRSDKVQALVQAPTSGPVQPIRVAQQPPRGHGMASNDEFSLEIHGVVFLANLMEFSFGEFNLILRMDWLMEHRVSLNYASKRVTLRFDEGSKIIMIGEHQDYLSNVISTLVAEKLVRKGCKAYLAFVSSSSFAKLSAKDVRIVRGFPNVFLEELFGVPLDKEVEFGIELLLGTTPVSIAPYRMAPKELIELKAQL
ncbi:uncharacterized protein LOC108477955 [Gossypium arboreum]|uniref:uncharacterized protein LOC108477955 n=1 Tax=Gossypium arboreum TaxID=29729 RepID=UPI000818FE68|nr:uncharacterized protein LOC108477955 [Gossypium arboreum]